MNNTKIAKTAERRHDRTGQVRIGRDSIGQDKTG